MRLRAFTLLDLLVIVAVIAILAGMSLPSLSRVRNKAQGTVDINNVKQIMHASALYEADNSDYMPHPTWGMVGEAGHPDGWAYAHMNNNRLPGLPSVIPSACGRDTNSMVYNVQMQFFKIGQLGPFLTNPNVMNCPKDVVQRTAGPYKTWWLARSMKITSYCMNGTVGGYVPSDAGLAGKTYKSTSFNPQDIVLWEANELNGAYFVDAGNNPLTAGEIISQRHSESDRITGNATMGGGAMIGRVGGVAEMMRMKKFFDLVNQKPVRQNAVLNGPGFTP